MIVRIALLAVALVAMGYCVHATSASDREELSAADKQRREEIRKLIEQLSADTFKEREAAMRRLMEGDDALAAVQEAVKSDDAEVRRRAEKALQSINKRLGKRAIQRALAKLKRGQTDQFVDKVVHWREYMDEEGWKGALEHAQAIADKAGKLNGGHKYKALPRIELAKLKFTRSDHLKITGKYSLKRQRIIADDVTVEEGMINDSFILCAKSIEAKSFINRCIVLANGNVNLGDSENLAVISDSLLVCDGNVTLTAQVCNSVILATGMVSVGAFVKDSVIISGGDVKVGVEFPDSPVDSLIKKSLIQIHQRDPLNFIHFFDLAEQGIEVKESRQQIRVAEVTAGRRFAQSGIRKGDRIEAVDGVKVASVEEFRRLLRRRMQASNAVQLDVRREDQLVHLVVRVPGDAP